MRRALPLLLAVTATLALVGCAATEAVEEEQPAVPAEVSPPSDTEPAAEDPAPASGPKPFTRKEKAWFSDVADGSAFLSDAFAILSGLSDPGYALNALAGDTTTVIEIATALAALQTCRKILHVGKSPTKRLEAIDDLLKRACAHYKAGATLAARGLDNLDAAQLTAGSARLTQGTTLVQRATKRLDRLRQRVG